MATIKATSLIGRRQRGVYHVNVMADNSASRNIDKNENDYPDGGGKSETILSAMDIDDYKPSYGGYEFFQPVTIASSATDMTKPQNTYILESQGQGSPPSHPDAAGRSAKFSNQFN